jgi:2-polyprenyl-6-methoxyphenol hydroxylase-like FAD-dependent oxidoreductase
VTVQVAGPKGAYEIQAAYLVGCDGTRGIVRSAAGIDFPGTLSTVLGWFGGVTLDSPPRPGSAPTPPGRGLHASQGGQGRQAQAAGRYVVQVVGRRHHPTRAALPPTTQRNHGRPRARGPVPRPVARQRGR